MYLKKEVLFIFLVFLTLRIIFIFTLPPFIDEAIYIEAGKISLSNANYRFFATDYWGKEALPIWLFGLGGNLTEDPIIGARAVVLTLSSISFFCLFFLTKNLLSRQAAYLAIILYTLCPGFILFNSLVQQDSVLLSINIIILYFLYKFKEAFSIKYSIILGLLIAILPWIKATSIIILGLFSITFIIFFITHKKFNLKKIYLLIIPFCLLILSIFLLSNSSDLSLILEQTSKYSRQEGENSLSLSFLWLKNLEFETFTLIIYLSPLVLFSLLFSKSKLKSNIFYILAPWTIIPLIFFALSSQSIKARYFIFSLASFLPILGFCFHRLLQLKKNIYIIVALAFLIPEVLSLIFVPYLFFGLFPKNSLIEAERDYAYSWPSGYGVREALSFFKDIHPKEFTFLILHEHPSNLPTSYILSYYFNREFETTKLIVAPFDNPESVSTLIKNINSTPAYFISNSVFVPEVLKPHLSLIKKFDKPGGEDFIGVYSLKF